MNNQSNLNKDDESSPCSSSPSTSDSDSGFFQIDPNTENTEKTQNPSTEKKPPPVIQPMARDPNRIPSSIFARSPAVTPVEWSVASNESLFSIHMDNSSFFRDQMYLTGRSEEMTRGFAGGTIENPSRWISPEFTSPVAGGAGDSAAMDEAAAASANAEAMREVMRAAVEGKESEKKVMLGRSVSRHSDGSTNSFAFPILTGDGRIGSIKVNFERHKDQQLNEQIKPSRLFADKAPTAKICSHRNASVSGQSKWWFPCFTTCKFRWCCHY